MDQKGISSILITLLVVVLASVGVVGYFFNQPPVNQIETQPPIYQATPTPKPTSIESTKSASTFEASSSADISKWKTYTNNALHISFMYPPEGTLYENKRASADGVFVKSPDSIQLNLPISCGQNQPDNSLLTATLSKDIKNIEVFNPDTSVKNISINTVEAIETINPVAGLIGSYQIGVTVNNRYYLIEGEPCFTDISRKILATFKFTK